MSLPALILVPAAGPVMCLLCSLAGSPRAPCAGFFPQRLHSRGCGGGCAAPIPQRDYTTAGCPLSPALLHGNAKKKKKS